MNNHNTKFEYKGMKTALVTDYTNKTFRMGKNVQVQRPSKIEKYLLNVHKMEGAHLQCVNNRHAKLEYKVKNTVGDTDYTKIGTP